MPQMLVMCPGKDGWQWPCVIPPGPLTAGLLWGRCRALQCYFTKLSLPPALGGEGLCENSRSCRGGWLPEPQALVRCRPSPMSQSRTEVQACVCSLWAGWQVTGQCLQRGGEEKAPRLWEDSTVCEFTRLEWAFSCSTHPHLCIFSIVTHFKKFLSLVLGKDS